MRILRSRLPITIAIAWVVAMVAAPAAAQETEPSFLARSIESAALFEQAAADDPYAAKRPCARAALK